MSSGQLLSVEVLGLAKHSFTLIVEILAKQLSFGAGRIRFSSHLHSVAAGYVTKSELTWRTCKG